MAGSPAAVTTASGGNPIPSGTINDLYREQLQFYSGSYETPMPNPTVAPAVTAAGGSPALPAGTYYCGYAWANGNGESQLSPLAAIVVGSGQQITITAPTKPSGVTLIDFYISPQPAGIEGRNVAFVGRQAGVALVVSALPTDASATIAPPFSGAGNGDTDDYRTNAGLQGGVPTKVLRGTDKTAYSTQVNDDSWNIALRQNHRTV